jgi:hypothetical protein
VYIDFCSFQLNINDIQLGRNDMSPGHGPAPDGAAFRPPPRDGLDLIGRPPRIGKLVPAPESAFPATVPGQTTFQGNPIQTSGDSPTQDWFIGQWKLAQASGHNTYLTIQKQDVGGQFLIVEASVRIRGEAIESDDRVIAKHRGGTGFMRDAITAVFDIDWENGAKGHYEGAWWQVDDEGNPTTYWTMYGKTWDLNLTNPRHWRWVAGATHYPLTPDKAIIEKTVPVPNITVERTLETAPNGWVVRLTARGFDAGEHVDFYSRTTGPQLAGDWSFITSQLANANGVAYPPQPYFVSVPPGYTIEFYAGGAASGKISAARGFS